MKPIFRIITQNEKKVVTETSKILSVETNVVNPGTLKNDKNMAFKPEIKDTKYQKIEQQHQGIIKYNYKVKKKEQIFSDEKVDNFVAYGINHDKHLVPENRKFEHKDNLVTKIEFDVKSRIEAGETRLEDPERYIQESKANFKNAFDPNNNDNGEMRGIIANVENQITNYFLMEDGGLSAEVLANQVNHADSDKVTYHSSLKKENFNSYTNAYELVSARKYSNITGYSVFVTGDADISNSEAQKFIQNNKIVTAENSEQKAFDFLVKKKVNGETIISFGDNKARSNNATSSNQTVDRHFDTTTTEIWSVGTARPETQIEIHTRIADKALAVCDKQPRPHSLDIEKKKEAILKYRETCDPKHLEEAPFVAVVIFNNDNNAKIIPHNVVDD